MRRAVGVLALVTVGAVALAVAPPMAVGDTSRAEAGMPGTSELPPRKVVVGTLMYAMWFEYPGLERRLEALASFVDLMAAEAQHQFRRGLDLVALPENAVTAGLRGTAADTSFPLEGMVLEKMGALARRHHTYLIVPMGLVEEEAKDRYYNVCVLLNREGKVAGIYRKVHPVDSARDGVLEGGYLPGEEFPVFTCDFGKVGIQICYDMSFDDGWEALARKGAELVIWSTASPQTVAPRCRARRYGYYIVSSTWRNNASFFDPTGAVFAQTTTPSSVLVQEIDLSYVLLDWQPALENGQALVRKYGDAVGFRYSEAEDAGIFWSNDPKTPIMEMVRGLDLEPSQLAIARNRELQDRLRGGPPRQD